MSELTKALNAAREIIGAIEGMALWCRHPEVRCSLNISGEPCSDRYNVDFDVTWSARRPAAGRNYGEYVTRNGEYVNTSGAYEAWCRSLNEGSLERDVMQMRAEHLNEAADRAKVEDAAEAAKDREWSTLLHDGYVSTTTRAGADYDVDMKSAAE